MKSKSAETTKLMVFGVLSLTAVFSGDAPLALRVIWVSISAYFGLRALLIAFKPRKCGHGVVTQSGPFMFPWIIDPCPKCRARSYAE